MVVWAPKMSEVGPFWIKPGALTYAALKRCWHNQKVAEDCRVERKQAAF